MASEALDRAFTALADGTRRGVIDLLRRRERRAGELASELDVSAPALTRHLRVLRDSGLVEELPDDTDGRARVYRLRRGPFTALQRWVDGVQAMWTDQLASFAAHARRRAKGEP